MGLLDIFKKPKSDIVSANTTFETLTAYKPVFYSWRGELYESELVRSAIDARARHNSKLRVEILGSAKPQLAKKLKKAPNSFQTWSQFLYRLSTILDMHNTAFIIPTIDKYGEIEGIFPAVPSKCEVLQTKTGRGVLKYTFQNNQTGACYLDECGIMTRFQYRSDFFGETNSALDDTMKLINMQNQGITEAIENGATYRFMATVNNFMNDDDLKNERERFSSKNFSSEASGGGLLLFPNTYKDIKQINSSPYTVNADERKLIQENIFNYYAVNESVLQSKAVGDAWNAFYESVIECFSIQLSEVLTKMLFSDHEQSFGNQVAVTSNRLQYMSNADKLNVSASMADRGLMSVNEIRDIWNLPPVEGGDVRTIRGEYYTINEDGTTSKEEGNE